MNYAGDQARIRVLVVDDQPLIRRGLALMLGAEANIAVFGQAANGEEAIELVRSQRPDVVLMDLQMPHVGGAELIETLRGWRQSLKVLCVSGTGQAPAGVDGFIAKPFSRDAFLAQVRTVLSGR